MSKRDPYAGLAEADKPAVNKLVNGIFAIKTGVTRKLGRKDKGLAAQWIAILRNVVKHQGAFYVWIKPVYGPVPSIQAAVELYDKLNPVPSWIKIARRELGQTEIPGKAANPRIMNYIYTCGNILQTENQRKYVAREGDEGVKWCSAFVNWCLRQVGMVGTNHALASSWSNWGEKLDRPQAGAIALMSFGGTRIDHVAFVDEVNGQFEMLGGNQRNTSGGSASQVTSRRLSRSLVRQYRWPKNADDYLGIQLANAVISS